MKRYLLPVLSLTALLAACSDNHTTGTADSKPAPQPVHYTGAMLDGYKGRVKEVIAKDNIFEYRNGVIDTIHPATGVASVAAYDSTGWLVRKEIMNIPDDGAVTIMGGKPPMPNGVNLLMKATRLPGRDSAMVYSTITGSWLNDSTYGQTYWLGKDTTRRDEFFVVNIYDAQQRLVARSFPVMQEKGKDGKWPMGNIRMVYTGNMITSYETANGHTDTSVTRVIARDKYGNAIKTTTVSKNNYVVSLFTYKYY